MIIRGKLIQCKREIRTFNGRDTKEKLFLSIAEVDLTDSQKAELKEAFKDAGKNFTPEWVKNFEGYVNTSTEYDLPCRDLKGEEHESIEKFIKEGKFPYMGAEVIVSLNVKDSAVYPNSIVFKSEGKAFNPFAEIDNLTIED